jgi:hypothetical protein
VLAISKEWVPLTSGLVVGFFQHEIHSASAVAQMSSSAGLQRLKRDSEAAAQKSITCASAICRTRVPYLPEWRSARLLIGVMVAYTTLTNTRNMRAFLRNTKSGHYLGGRGKWTPGLARACDFKSIERAIKHAEKNHLHGVELVVTSGDPPHLTALSDEILHPVKHSLTRSHD